MGQRRRSVLPLFLAIGAALAINLCAWGRETEDQLQQRIQSEQNPVRKAKDEIKLANLKFADAHDAYDHGQLEQGAKLLGTLVSELNDSWKLLHDSGRVAAKQPDGFRELEISLRENVRSLQDLERSVDYFDRGPLTQAEQDLDHIRDNVLSALFPDDKTHNRKRSSPTQNAAPAAGAPEAQ